MSRRKLTGSAATAGEHVVISIMAMSGRSIMRES